MSELPELIHELSAARAVEADALEQLTAAKARLAATQEHAAVEAAKGSASAARSLVDACESRLRAAAIEAFRSTGSKKPCAGVGIRVSAVLRYDDAAALAWAIEHRVALALDRKAFEAVAAAAGLAFVTKAEHVVATIAADLSASTAPAATTQPSRDVAPF